jgi:hypothetical protein
MRRTRMPELLDSGCYSRGHSEAEGLRFGFQYSLSRCCLHPYVYYDFRAQVYAIFWQHFAPYITVGCSWLIGFGLFEYPNTQTNRIRVTNPDIRALDSKWLPSHPDHHIRLQLDFWIYWGQRNERIHDYWILTVFLRPAVNCMRMKAYSRQKTTYIFCPTDLRLEFRQPEQEHNVKIALIIYCPSFTMPRLQHYMWHVSLHNTKSRKHICSSQ